jgi:amino acid adenylation domain-containing protein/non-ribosomal peptide synthase protein (TIGR01720 family)
MMTGPEKRQVLVEWNRTINQPSLEYLGRSIPDLFESQVDKSPDTIAVEYKDQRLSYFELNQRANQVAHYLHSIGVKRSDLVGLCVDRSLDSVVGIIGIIKCGAAYLPLDPEYPQDRLEFILQDAGAQVLLTHRQTWENMMLATEADRIDVIDHPVFLDVDWDRIEKCDDRNLSNDGTMVSSPSDLAYVIYTSGSTGLPKGTLVEHRSAINLWQGLVQKIYSRHGEKELRVSLNAPLPFDASVQEWLMLLSGHTLVIIPQEVRQDGDELLRFIREKEIDVLDCVPSQLKLLLAAGLLDGKGWTPPAILPGGEAIDLKTWNELVQAQGTEFYNMYGPTECTVDSTICRVKDSPLTPSIGLPVNNVQVYIVDKNMQPAPIGVPGELVIGGVGVGRGYHKRPDLTLEKFIKNPFRTYLNEEGLTVPEDDRLYRTGDLARYLPDGYLEYLGRIDSQVKLRGFRIELGEIEAVLAQIEGITEAVVIIREDTLGDKQLVAYIVQEGKAEIGVSQLRTYLKNKLPEYMIPSIFVSIAELPLTPNRKVDRKALPKPSGLRPELEATYTEPRTEQERMLVKIWSEILKLDRVGIHDNFFELGGDSILSIQVISRARQAGLILSPRHMFEAQTIADLAPLAGMAPVIQAEQGMVTGMVPLTPIQRWFFEQDFPNPDHWNQAILLSVNIPLRTDLLHDAFRYLVRHHDVLRMRFTKGSNSTFWVQENGEDVSEEIIEVIDLGNIKSDIGNPEGDEISFEQGQAIETFAAQAQSSLSLSKGPLLRVVYFIIGNNKPGRLLIVIHHLVIDGVSWRILLEDLQMVYQQLVDGRQVGLPLKTTSYQQWAVALGEFARSSKLTGADRRSELEFWVDTFASFLHARLPVDFPDGNNLETNAGSVRRMLGVEKTSQLLHRVSAAFNTEINDILLTALAKAFQHWTGRTALVVTLEGHGREDISADVDVTRTVGWFTSIYPAIIETGKNKNTGDMLMAVKEQLRKIPRRGIGYGLLRYLGESSGSGTQEDSDRDLKMLEKIPLGEVSFNYLGQVSQTLSEVSPFGEAHESTGFSHFPFGKRPFLIDIIASVIQDQLRVEWIYSTEIHLPTTIERLADWFITELQDLIDYCLSPEGVGYTPSDFPEARLTKDDLDDLLEELAEDEY